MKNLLFILSLCFIISSCGEERPGLSVEEYIATNNLTTTELAEGVHIIIHAPGTGSKPNINNDIRIAYEGRLTDGTVFDSKASWDSPLSGLIKGWQIGIPEIAIGGSCTLIIPPEAGYGSREVVNIPANSVLVFDIDLIDIFL